MRLASYIAPLLGRNRLTDAELRRIHVLVKGVQISRVREIEALAEHANAIGKDGYRRFTVALALIVARMAEKNLIEVNPYIRRATVREFSRGRFYEKWPYVTVDGKIKLDFTHFAYRFGLIGYSATGYWFNLRNGPKSYSASWVRCTMGLDLHRSPFTK